MVARELFHRLAAPRPQLCPELLDSPPPSQVHRVTTPCSFTCNSSFEDRRRHRRPRGRRPPWLAAQVPPAPAPVSSRGTRRTKPSSAATVPRRVTVASLPPASSPPPDPPLQPASSRARSPPPAVCKQQHRRGQGEARSCLARHCFSSLFFSHLAISLYVASDRSRSRAAMAASPSTLCMNASLLFALTLHRSSSHGYRASYSCFSFQFRQTCTRV